MSFREESRLPLVFLLLVAAGFGYGCPGKRTPALATAQPGERGATPSASEAGAAQAVDEGPDVRPIEGEGAYGTDIAGATLVGEGGPLGDIHFEYDTAVLTDEARGILEKHALWLQGQRDVRVTIEGHCDERGTTEYNLALGEQRARATSDYLASLGVAPDRLRIVSYGKERPLDLGSDDAAHARNRRAHFLVNR